MAFLHSAQLLYTDCGYPRWSVCFTMPNAVFFYMLFNDFYKKSYNKPIVVKGQKDEAVMQLANGHESENGASKVKQQSNGSTKDKKTE